jgi:hypothetical protein
VILQKTVIVINLINCSDFHLAKFPSTKLKAVLKKTRWEKLKAIGEMCAEGNNFNTYALSFLENFKTMGKRIMGQYSLLICLYSVC